MSDVVKKAESGLAAWWKGFTGWLRLEGGRISGRKVAGFLLIGFWIVLAIVILKDKADIAVRVATLLQTWPIFIAGSALIGLTIKPLV
jgi:hypothetical protein